MTSFALTYYIWPVRQQILLCSELGYYLDNPTEEEGEILIPFLKDHYFRGKESGLESETNPFLASPIIESVIGLESSDENIFFAGNRDDFWSLIALNWVIVRCDKSISSADKLHDEITFDVLSAYISAVDLYRGMYSAYTTYSLAVKHFEEGHTIVENSYFVLNAMSNLTIGLENYKRPQREIDTNAGFSLPHLAIKEITDTAAKLNSSTIISKDHEQIFQLGSMIFSCFCETNNYNLQILLMCSIIEYIIARNPDSSRFNVEDSIGKQFQFKTSLLINRVDLERNLGRDSSFLKLAYSFRSATAHGDYSVSARILKKFGRDILEFQHELQEITRLSFIGRIDHPEYTEFLKKH